MYKRKLSERITNQFYLGKIVIVYGARRVGKTCFVKMLMEDEQKKGKKVLYINCEHIINQQQFTVTNPEDLKKPLGNAEFIVFDEAQHVTNIGLILKILIDSYPELQIVATGSSSFDLANKTGETLTGRARRFILNPFAITELSEQFIDRYSYINQILVYGSYPSVFGKSIQESIDELFEITSNYLYKDVLMFDSVKNSSFIVKLLQLLAFQVGNEVSYNELASSLSVTRATVERYIDILEKCFVIFRLKALSRNLRSEISRNNKIYFYDLGIRNSLIQNFNNIHLRDDIGKLWENFCIVERVKSNSFMGRYVNNYFWRTYNQQEIDYIEEYNGLLHAYEFKYSPQAKTKSQNLFLETYPSEFHIINKENLFEQFIA
jgi:predicted AAA+ superfamily ATPase